MENVLCVHVIGKGFIHRQQLGEKALALLDITN